MGKKAKSEPFDILRYYTLESDRTCAHYLREPDPDQFSDRRKEFDQGEQCPQRPGGLSKHYCDGHYPLHKCRVDGCGKPLDHDGFLLCEGHYRQYKASRVKTEYLFWHSGAALPITPPKPRGPTPTQRVKALTAELTDLNSKLEAAHNELGQAKGEAIRLAEELESASALASSRAREIHDLTTMAHEARYVSRQLWKSMPAEGKVAYFESGNLWLPAWISEDGDPE